MYQINTWYSTLNLRNVICQIYSNKNNSVGEECIIQYINFLAVPVRKRKHK